MCGICGILQWKQKADHQLVQRMSQALRHRGPDSEGFYMDGRVGLGARRLRIIDLETGDQPVFNEDRNIVTIFNGEIYNYKALRQTLQARGHRFATASDTEIIPHLYEEYGPDCVHHLNGMFAFALWDKTAQTLLLARDHLGIKPLFYTVLEDGLLFASEMKALLEHPQVARKIDPLALDDLLTYRYIPSPRSILEGVKKLPPGHRLICQGTRVTMERYWDLNFLSADEDDAPSGDEDQWITRVKGLLTQAVEMQLQSDVPLGAFLSGGLDSSVVVALMASLSSQPVKTYTVGFKGWKSYDESEYARTVARHLNTQHHEIWVEAKALDMLPVLAAHFDEPMADPAAIPTYLMSQVARREVTVVLTGEGADELFAGYGWYGWAKPRGIASLLKRLPPSLRSRLLPVVELALRGRRGKRTAMATLTPRFEDLYFETIACTVFQSRERDWLYSPLMRERLAEKAPDEDFAYYLEHSKDYSPQGRMQYLDTKIWLPEDPLTKVDRMSMAVSLEARVPFLDYRLAELAASMPSSLKLKGATAKHILRRVAEGLLPAAILQRPKHAFDVPVSHWLRSELRHLIEGMPQHPAFRETGYLKPERIERLVRRHLSGAWDHGLQLWTLLNFAQWYETYIMVHTRE